MPLRLELSLEVCRKQSQFGETHRACWDPRRCEAKDGANVQPVAIFIKLAPLGCLAHKFTTTSQIICAVVIIVFDHYKLTHSTSVSRPITSTMFHIRS